MCVPVLEELLYLGHFTGPTCPVHDQLDQMHGHVLDKGNPQEAAFGEGSFMHGHSAIHFDHWEGVGSKGATGGAGAKA
jgi:hypothetical protein